LLQGQGRRGGDGRRWGLLLSLWQAELFVDNCYPLGIELFLSEKSCIEELFQLLKFLHADEQVGTPQLQDPVSSPAQRECLASLMLAQRFPRQERTATFATIGRRNISAARRPIVARIGGGAAGGRRRCSLGRFPAQLGPVVEESLSDVFVEEERQ
jgi:hypothetical protein